MRATNEKCSKRLAGYMTCRNKTPVSQRRNRVKIKKATVKQQQHRRDRRNKTHVSQRRNRVKTERATIKQQ
jgi:hypothetical protein